MTLAAKCMFLSMLICQCARAQTPTLNGCISYDRTESEQAANKWRQAIQEKHTADVNAFNRWLIGNQLRTSCLLKFEGKHDAWSSTTCAVRG